MQRFEEDKNQVLLYFTKLANEQICAPFVISESNKIEDLSNSTVKIYDYYKPEFEASEVNKTTTTLSFGHKLLYRFIKLMDATKAMFLYLNSKLVEQLLHK